MNIKGFLVIVFILTGFSETHAQAAIPTACTGTLVSTGSGWSVTPTGIDDTTCVLGMNLSKFDLRFDSLFFRHHPTPERDWFQIKY